MNMATDIRTLLVSDLKINMKDTPIHIVGQDIGGMVVVAYALKYGDDLKTVAWGECPIPGTKFYEESKASMGLWHFMFHRVPELPEALTVGRERTYIESFYDRFAAKRGALTKEDVDVYADAFSRPGAMRAGFNVYRAFERDAKENMEWIAANGKSKVKCLCLTGEESKILGPPSHDMAKEIFDSEIQVAEVAGSGHWTSEENPEDFIKKVLAFIE